MDQDFKTIVTNWCGKNLGDDKSEVVAVSRAELDRLSGEILLQTLSRHYIFNCLVKNLEV